MEQITISNSKDILTIDMKDNELDLSGHTNQIMTENQALKERIKDLEGFLMWCIKEGGTVQDFVLAINPDIDLDELKRLTDEYEEKYKYKKPNCLKK